LIDLTQDSVDQTSRAACCAALFGDGNSRVDHAIGFGFIKQQFCNPKAQNILGQWVWTALEIG
jgi:hypothetical protein